MQVKWGVLGTARIAHYATIPGMVLADSCELYAIAGRDPEKTKAFQEEFGFQKAYVGYDALLADPEVQAVYIPLPNHLHCEWVIKALRAGKDVLCEKPLAMNAVQAREMFRVAEEEGRLLMEAYAYQHSPYIRSLKEDIRSGLIGEIDYIDSAFLTQGYTKDIRLVKEMGGGSMYDLGCYSTSLILSLVDSRPVLVKADAEYTDSGIDILANGLIRFENGVRATFSAGMMLGKIGRYDRLFIHGSKGYLRSEIGFNQSGESEYKIVSNGETIIRHVTMPHNYSLEAEHLSHCILKGEKPVITPEYSIRNAELLDALLADMGY